MQYGSCQWMRHLAIGLMCHQVWSPTLAWLHCTCVCMLVFMLACLRSYTNTMCTSCWLEFGQGKTTARYSVKMRENQSEDASSSIMNGNLLLVCATTDHDRREAAHRWKNYAWCCWLNPSRKRCAGCAWHSNTLDMLTSRAIRVTNEWSIQLTLPILSRHVKTVT